MVFGKRKNGKRFVTQGKGSDESLRQRCLFDSLHGRATHDNMTQVNEKRADDNRG